MSAHAMGPCFRPAGPRWTVQERLQGGVEKGTLAALKGSEKKKGQESGLRGVVKTVITVGSLPAGSVFSLEKVIPLF